jgi:hypothetical protein
MEMSTPVLFPKLFDLSLYGVKAPGVPNQECVYLRANVDVNIGEYLLLTGWELTDNIAVPLPNDVFWPGHVSVNAGTWVLIFTGPGQTQFTTLDNGEPGVVLHWGKPTTVFNFPKVKPVLVRIDAVQVGKHLPTT